MAPKQPPKRKAEHDAGEPVTGAQSTLQALVSSSTAEDMPGPAAGAQALVSSNPGSSPAVANMSVAAGGHKDQLVPDLQQSKELQPVSLKIQMEQRVQLARSPGKSQGNPLFVSSSTNSARTSFWNGVQGDIAAFSLQSTTWTAVYPHGYTTLYVYTPDRELKQHFMNDKDLFRRVGCKANEVSSNMLW
jgi:hypothetical protein